MEKLDYDIVMDAAALVASGRYFGIANPLQIAGANLLFIQHVFEWANHPYYGAPVVLTPEEITTARVLLLLTFAEIGLTDE